MLKLTKDQYENIVFLTKCVYYDLPWPSLTGYKQSEALLSGLRLNIFDTPSHVIVVICGTNQLRDWFTNLKVALGITPRQYQQALSIILNTYRDMQPEKPLIISGHSLGAGIAEYCASFFHDDVLCLSFNGCPVNHLCANKCSCNIINIVNKHDILNSLCKLLPGKYYMKHLSKSFILEDDYILFSVKSHSDFNNFLKFEISDIYED